MDPKMLPAYWGFEIRLVRANLLLPLHFAMLSTFCGARFLIAERAVGYRAAAMIKGSEIRKADFPIEPLLLDRWSPRAMSGEEIAEQELMRLFEAARWAPSSFNAQQWRALYARRGTEHWPVFFELLVEANKSWAKNAAALVVFISRKTFDYNNEPSITHSYDAGAAWENFALQGFRLGLVVHGMEGFDYERARVELRIPDEFQVEAMAAVGWPGPKEVLPEKLQKRESPNDRRRLTESICEGPFRF
jgi:nitroreductase